MRRESEPAAEVTDTVARDGKSECEVESCGVLLEAAVEFNGGSGALQLGLQGPAVGLEEVW